MKRRYREYNERRCRENNTRRYREKIKEDIEYIRKVEARNEEEQV